MNNTVFAFYMNGVRGHVGYIVAAHTVEGNAAAIHAQVVSCFSETPSEATMAVISSAILDVFGVRGITYTYALGGGPAWKHAWTLPRNYTIGL